MNLVGPGGGQSLAAGSRGSGLDSPSLTVLVSGGGLRCYTAPMRGATAHNGFVVRIEVIDKVNDWIESTCIRPRSLPRARRALDQGRPPRAPPEGGDERFWLPALMVPMRPKYAMRIRAVGRPVRRASLANSSEGRRGKTCG